MSTKANRWADDKVQFARLLCEIVATQEGFDIKALCDAMDLEESDVQELFDRAERVWGAAKSRRKPRRSARAVKEALQELLSKRERDVLVSALEHESEHVSLALEACDPRPGMSDVNPEVIADYKADLAAIARLYNAVCKEDAK